MDCSGTANAVDALKLLRHSAGLSVGQNEPCDDIGTPGPHHPVGDLNCDGQVNSVDGLTVLRMAAGLSVPYCANPLNVQVTPDPAHANTGEIGPAGGTLAATGADGSVFTLTVPPNALLSPLDITMTPVSSIGGLPFAGGLSAAVVLQPHGLRLFEPATLTIVPASSPAIVDEVTFMTTGDGELYLYPPDLGVAEIRLSVLHFSTGGVASGTDAEVAIQQQNSPTAPENGLSQEVYRLFANERRAQLLGGEGDPEFGSKVRTKSEEYYQTQIAPNLTPSETNCQLARTFTMMSLAWARQVGLLGDEDDFQTEINLVKSSAVLAIANCYNDSYEDCILFSLPEKAIELLRWLRVLTLLSSDDQVDASLIAKCARFEVDFESEMEATPFAIGFHSYSHVRVLHIVFDINSVVGPTEPEPSPPAEYLDWQVTGGCSIAGATQVIDPPAEVLEVRLDLNTYDPSFVGPLPPKFQMKFRPPSVKEEFVGSGAEGCGSDSYWITRFLNCWTILHSSSEWLNGFVSISGSEYWVEMAIDQAKFGAPDYYSATCTEHTTFKVRHTPDTSGLPPP